MKPLIWLLSAGAVIVLAGCASATLYQPAATPEAYGYRAINLTPDRYRVSFTGNYLTPREKVETYALYRAAEVTVEAGYERFKLVSRETEAITDYDSGGGVTIGYGGFWNPFFGGISTGLGGGDTDNRYRTVAEILVGPRIEGAEGADIYDASELLSTLDRRVLRPG